MYVTENVTSFFDLGNQAKKLWPYFSDFYTLIVDIYKLAALEPFLLTMRHLYYVVVDVEADETKGCNWPVSMNVARCII